MVNPLFICCSCLLILYYQLNFVNSKSLYGEGVPVQKPYIPLTQEQFIHNYKNFASKLIKNNDLTDVIDGVIYGPFNLGHTLAVLHEHVVLNVSTNGFSNALETSDLQITNSYRDLLQILLQDPNVSITSTMYTQHVNAQLTVGIGKLKSKVMLVDAKKTQQEYIEFINENINNKTKFGVPVPAFPIRNGIPDGDYYANTFNYKNSWGMKWKKTHKNHSFNSLFSAETIEFMETSGRFDYISNHDFEAIKIPLQGLHKMLLFAKSKKQVDLWDASGKDVWEPFITTIFKLKSNEWTSKMIKLQVPKFEYLSGTSYFTQLKKLGITEAMCQSVEPGRNSLDQIAQISKMKMTDEEFTLTVITETKDNISDKIIAKSRKTRHADPEPEAEQPVTQSNKSEDKKQGNDELNLMNIETIILDQPYFWSLEDENIGSIALGAILLPVERFAKLSSNYMEQYLQCEKVKQ